MAIRAIPLERLYRDNRLNAIHEGTYGIQANDLLSRKVAMAGGRGFELLMSLVAKTAELAKQRPALEWHGDQLGRYLSRLTNVTQKTAALLETSEAGRALANAVQYLDAFGHIVVGWMWLRQALIAETALKDEAHVIGRFIKANCLPASSFIDASYQR